MLTLHKDHSDTWKVLIYDKHGLNIISPILKLNELRDIGITIHMNIKSERQPIPDVVAVYFLAPTEENILLLKKDFEKKLYDEYHLNFTHTIPRALLEQLAAISVETGVSSDIAQVWDEYLNFSCLDEDAVTLNVEKCYAVLNSNSSSEYEIGDVVDRIVVGLFCVCVTMGVIPVIKFQKGNAAEMIAKKLETKLRDYYSNARDVDINTYPVLVILDRMIDFSSMIMHTWTYTAMIHDVFGISLNRVSVQNGLSKYDIDTGDFFYSKNRFLPFPQVATDVNAEITKYKADVEKVTKSCGVKNLEELGNTTENLKVAITALPELTERKRIIDMHMSIALALMDIVKQRQLDLFFEIEEAIARQNTASLMEILKDEKKDPKDKIRLVILFLLSNDTEKGEFTQVKNLLKEQGCDLRAVEYIESMKSFLKLTNTTSSKEQQPTNDLFGAFSSISNKLQDKLQQTGVVGTGLDAFISSVKNLLPIRKDFPVAQTVGSVISGTDDLVTIDPVKKNRISEDKDVLVFMVGGGNYTEYQNLVEHVQKHGMGRKVIYGCTDMPSPTEFVEQLNQLTSSS